MSQSPQARKHVVIIGAGPGGLAAAMILGARGYRVTVYEKEAVVGGRNAEVVLDDKYRFDLGPTFLMMKYLLDELFTECGRDIRNYLDCRRLDPMYRLIFDGKEMLVSEDRERMKREIEKHFPGEGPSLDKFHERESQRFERLYPCLQRDYGRISQFFSTTLLKAFPHLAAGKSLYDVLGEYFRSEELRLAFTFQSKYLGMSPWDCPGLFAMIPYTEHAHGIYHVMGGLNKITEALAAVAKEFGAEIHTARPVKQVRLEGRRAVGVELASGESVDADAVFVNADFGHAMEHLFAPGQIKKYTPEKLKTRNYSCSTFMMYLGLDRTYPECEHHMIVFAKDYQKNLEDISHRKVTSEDVSVYVRNSVTLDPGCAPAGHSALYVLCPVPNNTSGIDWSREKATYRERILRILEERSPYRNLRQHIRSELIVTPDDWQNKRSVFLGATFNMGHNISQMLYRRPHNEFEEISDCYLVGGGTHPGSGLPTIFESARISANLLCERDGIAFPRAKEFSELTL